MSATNVVYLVFVAMLMVSSWLIGNRIPSAWLLAIAARLGMILWAAFTGATALAPVAAGFIIIDWRNYRKARKERAVADKIAHSIIDGEEPE